MARRRKRVDVDLTPEEVLIYGCATAGLPIKELAAQTGIHRNTLGKWIKKVRKFAENSQLQIEDYRTPIHALYPLWLRSVIMNLKACDPQITLGIGRGMQYLVDKSEVTNKDMNAMTDEDINGLISGIIKNATGGQEIIDLGITGESQTPS